MVLSFLNGCKDADKAETAGTVTRIDSRIRQDMSNMEARRKAFNEELDKLLELRLSEIRSVCAKVEGEKADILELEDARETYAVACETLEKGSYYHL